MNPTRRRRQLILAAAVLVVIVGVAWSQSGGNNVDKIASDPSGKTLHNYQLLALDGSKVKLDQYRGKPLVVNFWAQSCGPCRQEMPAFEAVAQQVGDTVKIVGVNSGDSLKITDDYVHEVAVTYTILRDAKQEYAGRELVVLPTTLFVNADGQIVSTRVGAMSADELRGDIKSLFG